MKIHGCLYENSGVAYMKIHGCLYENSGVAYMKEKFPCRATNLKISSVLFIFFNLILRIWANLIFQNLEKARICCLFGAFLCDLD